MSVCLKSSSPDIVQEKTSVQEPCIKVTSKMTDLTPLSEEDVFVSGIADKHPRDMPEMAFVIAFCVQYNEAVGNLAFLPEELEDAIVCREPVDLVERVHRYFLRNVLNYPKIIDKRYWIRKLSQHLYERIEKEEFGLSYNPFERVDDVYHELSNFEKVLILKYLVMWQFKGSEKIQALRAENVVRPVEIEALGFDTKGSIYYYLGVGARIYRETPSTETQQCIWETLTTVLRDLKDLVASRVEIDPDRSEEERLLYNRISEELIPDLESKERLETIGNQILCKRGFKKVAKKNRLSIRYNKPPKRTPKISLIEEIECEHQTDTQEDADEFGSESILAVSMSESVTHLYQNSQAAQTVHDVKRLPVKFSRSDSNQEIDTSSIAADSTSAIDSLSISATSTTILSSGQETDRSSDQNQNNFIHRPNAEIGTLKDIKRRKRWFEEELSDEYDSSDSDDFVEFNRHKLVKLERLLDDDFMFKSHDDNERAERHRREKGKRVLRDRFEPSHVQNVDINRLIVNAATLKPRVDKGKGVLRYGEPVRGSSVNHDNDPIGSANREIFRPGPEDLIKLEWSLNHVFFEGLEIFGEDSDSELSDCCDDCIMEIDHFSEL
ncbi:16922_t:CDS:2 [Funneliformis geosporum]|uniref:6966_t:CDS:1 n=1 Tax=Funneliformis geosporum TaxID=1117311 RepID=A0A9W4SB84_9GLOM|nr:6966_t:CDS:2 [Funneliformis geosporum]CAI2164140.1 16922_t:CDS:2 [Funneliformis geosporum]